MKSVGIQHLEALAKLNTSGYTPVRTIYALFVPDEEVGGVRGMSMLLRHQLIKEMNPGLVLDEGLASPGDKYSVFYGERKVWWLKVRSTGAAGHGSRFIQGTAVEKLMRVANKILAFREEQRLALEASCGCGKQLGDFTTMNLTMLHAGEPSREQYNVIPVEAEAGFDCRIPTTVDLKEFRRQLDEWCGEDATYELVNGTGHLWDQHAASPIDQDAYWWNVFLKACEAGDVPLHEPSVFPAASDGRWVRLQLPNTACYGFSPMRRTPILLHDHDEYIPVSEFLDGIDVFARIIPALADAAPPTAA